MVMRLRPQSQIEEELHRVKQLHARLVNSRPKSNMKPEMDDWWVNLHELETRIATLNWVLGALHAGL